MYMYVAERMIKQHKKSDMMYDVTCPILQLLGDLGDLNLAIVLYRHYLNVLFLHGILISSHHGSWLTEQ